LLAELADSACGLYQEGLRAQHVISQKCSCRGQLATPRPPLDQADSKSLLDIRDVLGDRRLTDPKLAGGG
jgi:hypothetical protein